MALCPHCQRDTIRTLDGHLGWRRTPDIVCLGCGGKSRRDLSRTKWLEIAAALAMVLPFSFFYGPYIVALSFAAVPIFLALHVIEQNRRPLVIPPPEMKWPWSKRAI
jgi:hypothetical protein